jgi:glutathione S-transferase
LRAGAAVYFARFDEILQRQPFLLGEQPVYADFLLWGILTNYTWNGWNEIPAAMTALRGWFQRMTTWAF